MRVLAAYLLLMLIAMGSTGYLFGGRAKGIGARLSQRTATIEAITQ